MMEAVKYFAELRRMCDHYTAMGPDCCSSCPILDYCSNSKLSVFTGTLDTIEECVAIVEKWSSENPPATNSKVFEAVFGFRLEDKFLPSTVVSGWLQKEYKGNYDVSLL